MRAPHAVVVVALLFTLGCGSGGPTPNPSSPPQQTPTEATPTPSPRPTLAGPTPTARAEATCLAPAEPARGGELQLEPWIDTTFERPVAMAQPPNADAEWYVVEQRGTIRRITHEADPPESTIALDWRGIVVDPVATGSAETGLLGIAFHPDHPDDARVFVYATLTPEEPGACPRIAVAELMDLGGTFDPVPRRLLVEHETNCTHHEDGTFESGHNAGTMHFDPTDGSLVVAVGDLARKERALDPTAIEGTLLRLDVDALPIQAATAFDGVSVSAEVIAYGLRNPWKWSFDRVTGEIWLGDVGHASREEINRIEHGGNYGWPAREGELCRVDPCDLEDFIDPVHAYPRGMGCSVTGGYVYRGAAHPDLEGLYLFADWCSGLVWGLRPVEDEFVAVLLADVAAPIVSFAEGNDGELLVLDFAGRILRVRGFRWNDRPGFPTLLSETGCVHPEEPREPAAGLTEYEVNVPFWSDGATKTRWLSVPAGERIHVEEDGDFTLPVGSVLMKEFVVRGQRVETRLLMKHANAGWRGYAYAWNGNDAVLASPFGEARPVVGGGDWQIPGRRECSRCHTKRAGHTLGLEVAQLDRAVLDERGVQTSQLDRLVEGKLLDGASLQRAASQSFPDSDTDISDHTDREAAARAYLHVNCAPCHRPGAGTYFPAFDLRASIPLGEAGLCDVEPSRFFPGRELRLLAPASAERSVLLGRVEDSGDLRMPPLATREIDDDAAALLRDWISSLGSCPASVGARVDRRLATQPQLPHLSDRRFEVDQDGQ